jgi:hypothetical protein
VGNQVVRDALTKDGNDCLPLTLVDGAVVCKGKYPTRKALAGFAKVEFRSEENEEKSAPCCCGGTEATKGKAKKKVGKSCC